MMRKSHGKIHEDLDDGLIESTDFPMSIFLLAHLYIQWPFQEPIDWRYLPYIRPM